MTKSKTCTIPQRPRREVHSVSFSDRAKECAADPRAATTLIEPTVLTHQPTQARGPSHRTYSVNLRTSKKSKKTTRNRWDEPQWADSTAGRTWTIGFEVEKANPAL